jgi:dihydrofolate reductase
VYRICFVCLGNICRSPTAEGVMRALLAEHGLADRVAVDSAGTGRWHLGEPLNEADRRARDMLMRPRGAYVMGRNMFGPIRGPWQSDWRGWWGDEPPYHAPVFVLTHHARDPIEMEGGTTFHFVTDGIESALEQATTAADGKDVSLGGGATAVQQYLTAGLVDEILISLVPVFLGGGTRLFDNLGEASPRLEQVQVVEAPGVTHVRYRRREGS